MPRPRSGASRARALLRPAVALLAAACAFDAGGVAGGPDGPGAPPDAPWADLPGRVDAGAADGEPAADAARADAPPPDAPAVDAPVSDAAPGDGPAIDAPGPADASIADAPPVAIVGGLAAGDPGRFADGALAGSCAGYRWPPAGYAYAGSIGDGVYRIDVDGAGPVAAVEVFCDMSTDGGGWTAIAANGEIAADETTAAGDCYPLISPDPARGCGSPSDLGGDFSLPGAVQAGLSWRALLAVAYGDAGYGAKLAYFGIDFGAAAPTAAERIGGAPYDPPGLATAHGVIHCGSEPTSRIAHYAVAGGACNDHPSYVANGRGTVFGHATAADMCSSARRTFGFTDRQSTDGVSSLRGLDDYQDGWSCADSWVPKAARGARLVVLVR